MTTIKIEKLLPVFNALQVLATVKMPVKPGYRIGKNLRLARTELDTYEQSRIKLAEELSGGKMKPNTNEFDFTDEARKTFTERHKELLSEEVEVNFMTMTTDELGTVEIEPWIFDALDGTVIVEAKQAEAA